MVSLLVAPRGVSEVEQAAALREVVEFLQRLDPRGEGGPTVGRTLLMARSPRALETEARLLKDRRSGLFHALTRWRGAFRNVWTQWLLRLGWKGYLEKLVAHTDYRKFDDTLRMVLDLTAEQRAQLERFLETRQVEGKLFYGTSASDAAVMTCFISRYDGEHVHFVDGAQGGYALAAQALKAVKARASEKGA